LLRVLSIEPCVYRKCQSKPTVDRLNPQPATSLTVDQ
jgi:hypothetical protein